MMIAKGNDARNFYGKRPPLATQLGPLGGTSLALTRGNTGALGQSVAQVFIPGSVGGQIIGGLTDKLADKAGQAISAWSPTLGKVLYFVTDALDFVVAPAGKYLGEMITGAVTYLPEAAANGVLQYIDDNKTDLIIDAAKDALYARYRRIAATGNSAKDIKEGRDTVVAIAFKGILEALGVGLTAERLANTIYKKAIELGATDYQAGAAVGYGMINGLACRGLPQKIKIETPVGTIEVKGGPDSAKDILDVKEAASVYLSKLGTPVEYTSKWIEDQFAIKQGIKRSPDEMSGGGSGGMGGFLLPAAALLAVVLLTRGGKKKEAA